MKKITKALLSVIVLFCVMLNVHAVTINTNTTAGTVDTNSKYVTNTSTLTVSGVQSADTFKAYKILDAFYNSNNNTFTYEFTSTFKTFLATTNDYKTLTVNEYQALTSGNITNGSTTTNSTLDTLVSLYASYIKTNNVSGSNMTVTGTNATATLEAGAWLVLPVTTTKVYSVMVGNIEFKANTNGDDWDITTPAIVAKVSNASVTKVLKDTSTTEGSYSIDEEFTYVITASIPTYPTNATNKTLTITEMLDTGIILNLEVDFPEIRSIIIKDGGTTLSTNNDGTVVDNDNHTVATITKDGQKITINFNADYITSNTLTIEYTGRLNYDNMILGTPGNKTTTTLTYANEPYGTATTTTSEVVNTVRTYGIRLLKHNSDNEPLEGARYTIYSDANLTNQVGDEGDLSTGPDGYAIFNGLAAGTYYLKETAAPTGYKISTDIITVNIDTTKTHTDVDATNIKMGLLPSTGGVGTYIFIVIGAIVVIGALVFLYKYLNKNKNGK